MFTTRCGHIRWFLSHRPSIFSSMEWNSTIISLKCSFHCQQYAQSAQSASKWRTSATMMTTTTMDEVEMKKKNLIRVIRRLGSLKKWLYFNHEKKLIWVRESEWMDFFSYVSESNLLSCAVLLRILSIKASVDLSPHDDDFRLSLQPSIVVCSFHPFVSFVQQWRPRLCSFITFSLLPVFSSSFA